MSRPQEITLGAEQPPTGLADNLAEFAEGADSNAPLRGALMGMLLGAALWGGILVLTGVVKI